jgi:transposase-like protein
MSKKRKKYSAEEKVRILKKPLVDRVAVSDLCDQHGISPPVFYRWQKHFFENGAVAFKSRRESKETRQDQRIRELEQKLAAKNEVVS